MSGESFGLVGESGSGKSTIAKMIVNLFKPTSGDIFFDKVCITKIKQRSELMKFRKQIQMIFQDPYSSLNGRLKVKDIIAEPITEFLEFSEKKLSSKHLLRFFTCTKS